MAFEPLLGGSADTAHAAHGKRIEKRALGPRVDDGEAARLIHVGGDFRNRLRGSHAYRARDAELLDPLLDAPRHGNGMLPVGSRGSDVEEGLVDADLLHERSLVVQDGHNLVADLLIPVEPARGPDGLRAKLARRYRGHGRMDAELARFIGGRGYHAVLVGASPDDDGLAAPSGMVELLDGGEERIKVDQQDCRPFPCLQGKHALMFVRIDHAFQFTTGHRTRNAVLLYAFGFIAISGSNARRALWTM